MSAFQTWYGAMSSAVDTFIGRQNCQNTPRLFGGFLASILF